MRLLRFLGTAIAAAMFMSAPVYAAQTDAPDPRPAIVMMAAEMGCKHVFSWWGTGFVIGSQPAGTGTDGKPQYLLTFMTAHHVIHGAPCMQIAWYDGHKDDIKPTAISYKNYPNDISVFEVLSSHPSESLILGTQMPTWGENVSAIGFPNLEPWQLLEGHVSGNMQTIDTAGPANPDGSKYQALPCEMQGYSAGISGAPVFDADGNVFGVASAVDISDEDTMTPLGAFVVIVPTIVAPKATNHN